jgi:hypothetical protein
VEPEFDETHRMHVSTGYAVAQRSSIAFVAICRNAMPFLPMTLARVKQTGEMFADWKCFIYENDSTDGTKEYLAGLDGDKHVTVRSVNNGRPHLNYTKIDDRTIPLAEYRNACRDWCRENAADFDYAIVLDADPWAGWSVGGVANTLGWLDGMSSAAGMGAYSWAVWGPPMFPQPIVAHYDAWACRWNWWEERQNMLWFHLWHPPVGSPPVRMNSCFGQLGVYDMWHYLKGEYRGGDCEHVHHWRTCGGDCFLNPSQRVVSFWIPDPSEEEAKDGGLPGDLQEDVAGRNADQDHR